MLEKFLNYCNVKKSFIFDNEFSIYEILLKGIEKLNETIDYINGYVSNFQKQLDKKEDSTNLTVSRKLSPNGNFTGTWFGDTKTNIDQKILNNTTLYNEVLNLINSNPELNIEIIDGKFFATVEVIDEIDGGSFTEAVTSEIDAGLFMYH